MSGQPNPKDLILQNKGLVIVYVIALVPLIAYFVVIGGMKDATAQKLNALQRNSKTLEGFARRVDNPDPSNPVYTNKDIERLTERQAKYQAEVDSLGSVVEARDKPLERKFEKFAGKEKIDTDDFNAELRVRLANLASEERFKALVTDPDNEDRLFTNQEKAENPAGIATIQKRYWIQEALLEALKKGGALRLASEVEFLPAPTEQEPAYKRVPVRLSFYAQGKDIPFVVREVLARNISFRVVRMKVEKAAWRIRHDFNPQFEIQLDGLVFEKPVYEVELEDHESFGDWKRWVPEPPLKIELEIEAFDFNNEPE